MCIFITLLSYSNFYFFPIPFDSFGSFGYFWNAGMSSPFGMFEFFCSSGMYLGFEKVFIFSGGVITTFFLDTVLPDSV